MSISIHAPLTGSDVLERFYMRPERGFQSTLPLRGATPGRRGKLVQIPISIHAPLTGSDFWH